MSRLLQWERLALNGDFSAVPKRFRWEASGRFAHHVTKAMRKAWAQRVREIAMPFNPVRGAGA